MPNPTAPALNPPKQPRSRRTLERIVKAALGLLDELGPGGVTVQAVVARAGSSVGSFYARFGGKDGLLEYLAGRVWDEALGRWEEAVASRSWSEMDLGELAGGAANLLFDIRRSRVEQLRALDRMAGGTGAYQAFRDRLLGDLESLLLERRGEIVHESPELAVRLGLRAVLGVVDADVGPDGVDEGEARRVLVGECRDLLLSYLGGRPAGDGGTQQVDFFDVWG